MYVTLGNQIRDYLNEHEVKDTYGLTWTEVNTIETKVVSILSNLVKIKKINTTDLNEDIYATACDIVLNYISEYQLIQQKEIMRK
jgi:hypothetical protein